MWCIDKYWNWVPKDRIPKQFDLYEFGVANPYTSHSSTKMLLQFCINFNIQYDTYHGFDSFLGLPEIQEKDSKEECNKLGWHKGAFSALDFFKSGGSPGVDLADNAIVPKLDTVEEVAEHLTCEYEKMRIHDNQTIEFTPGYLEESLPKINTKNFKPALIAHIDVDLYSSTYQALDFLFSNNLIVDQTYILFDDWYCCSRDAGQQLAFREIRKKYPQFVYDYYGFDGASDNMSTRGFRVLEKNKL